MSRQWWERVVFCQFHDAIPGSSIPEVYDDLVPELESISSEAEKSPAALLDFSDQPEAVFNPLPLARNWHHNGKSYLLPPLSVCPIEQLCFTIRRARGYRRRPYDREREPGGEI